MTGTHTMPIGQVFFVPREEVSLVDCTAEEIDAIKRYREEYFRLKAEQKLTTRYGLQYSPHYAQESRAQRDR
jgi:hypothetical protein